MSGRSLVFRIRWAVLAIVSVGLVGPASPSVANEFTINTCQADRAEYSTQAFEDFATRGMMWKRACNPEGGGERGLITGNVVRRGRVPRGARSYFVLRAPDGTRFTRLRWAGTARRRDCRYALQLWASRPDGAPIPITNVRANRGCPNRPMAQAAYWAKTFDIAGATTIVQRIICVGSKDTPYCSSRDRNYLRTYKAEVGVDDNTPPAVQILQDNPFTLGHWVNGTQTVNYNAVDNVGIMLIRATVAGAAQGDSARPCNYARRIPCDSGPGALAIDTSKLAEGSQLLVVQAHDAAANPADSQAVTVRVDNTAPGAVPVGLAGGEAWRNENDFHLTWTNEDEGDRAPIAAAHYRLCRTDGGGCVEGSRSGTGIAALEGLAVPSPGEWHARLWREDAATNREPTNASVPVPLRFDPEPPQLGFEESPASDPTLVSVLVTDKTSGLAGGQIELSLEGSGSWQTLPTEQVGSRLVARIDDSRLPAGRYLLRATARDQASNQNSTDSRLDGRAMTLDLPLRVSTAMRAGVLRDRVVRRTIRRKGKRRTMRRRASALEAVSRIGFGRRLRIDGWLESHDGRPIPGAEVHVLSRSVSAPEQVVAVVQTDAAGHYVYAAEPGSSRTLRFAYRGTGQTLPAQSEVTLVVPAASTIRPRPRRLQNGQAVRFTGRVRSSPVPAGGKLVELQVVLSGRWQTFRTVRTDAHGDWDVRYRFRRSCGLTPYRFRARLPAEAGYPYADGVTGPVDVRVRGAPCR